MKLRYVFGYMGYFQLWAVEEHRPAAGTRAAGWYVIGVVKVEGLPGVRTWYYATDAGWAEADAECENEDQVLRIHYQEPEARARLDAGRKVT